jgi:Na+/H+-dicarboxylate symporter
MQAALRWSLSVWIVLGLGLGVLVGLFFGEGCEVLQPVVDIYIRVMQMTVLPYLVMALVVGFGQLNHAQARRLGLRAGALLLVTWVLTVAVIAALQAAFPDIETAAFFSNALVEPRDPFPIADLYFTANPFNSLSTGAVPAIVLFSTLLGLGLMGLDGKERVLDDLRLLNQAVTKITLFTVKLTPVGVFAIGAVTIGTMPLDTFQRLEVYLIAFSGGSLLLTFGILPLLVTSITPFSYREVVSVGRDALFTAFVTNNAFIVLPMISERVKVVLRQHGVTSQDGDSSADVLVPILFNFPNAGRLMTLLFVPFAAWLAAEPLGFSDLVTLFALGVPTYFAKAQVALPFLLDVFSLPQDLFQLYIPTTVIGGKFDSMVTVMNLLVFGLLGAAGGAGRIVIRPRRLAVAGSAMIVGGVLTVLAVRTLFGAVVNTTYTMDEALRHMHSPTSPLSGIVHADPSSVSMKEPGSEAPGLARIRARKTLRVGYDPDNIPFTFFNSDRELVGMDVELVYGLASALAVTPEFVPIKWPALPSALASGLIDIMPGVWYRPYWFSSLLLSRPYLTQTMGLAVLDARRHEFVDVEALRKSRGLRIGIPLDATQVQYSMSRYFGGADVQFVVLESPSEFFKSKRHDIDAFLLPVEGGAAQTLLHPEYTVVVPQPAPVRVPLAFGAALGAEDLVRAIDEWLVFAEAEGTLNRAHEYWILGKGVNDRAPHWSILRDVLGWKRTSNTP